MTYKMNFIKEIIEPKTLFLVWQPSKAQDSSRTRRIVGRLERGDDGVVRFNYERGDDLEIAMKLGLEKYGPFEDLDIIYDEGVMDVFLRRLPNRKRNDFPEFLTSIRIFPFDKYYNLVDISDFALLGYSGGYLPQDSFSIINRYDDVEGKCQLLEEIAGFRYYIDTTKANIFMEIALGDEVSLEPEPNNDFDSNAVMVKFLGKKIGNINRVISPTFRRWLNERRVTAIIEKVVGTVERPRVILFVNVS